MTITVKRLMGGREPTSTRRGRRTSCIRGLWWRIPQKYHEAGHEIRCAQDKCNYGNDDCRAWTCGTGICSRERERGPGNIFCADRWNGECGGGFVILDPAVHRLCDDFAPLDGTAVRTRPVSPRGDRSASCRREASGRRPPSRGRRSARCRRSRSVARFRRQAGRSSSAVRRRLSGEGVGSPRRV